MGPGNALEGLPADLLLPLLLLLHLLLLHPPPPPSSCSSWRRSGGAAQPPARGVEPGGHRLHPALPPPPLTCL